MNKPAKISSYIAVACMVITAIVALLCICLQNVWTAMSGRPQEFNSIFVFPVATILSYILFAIVMIALAVVISIPNLKIKPFIIVIIFIAAFVLVMALNSGSGWIQNTVMNGIGAIYTAKAASLNNMISMFTGFFNAVSKFAYFFSLGCVFMNPATEEIQE